MARESLYVKYLRRTYSLPRWRFALEQGACFGAAMALVTLARLEPAPIVVFVGLFCGLFGAVAAHVRWPRVTARGTATSRSSRTQASTRSLHALLWLGVGGLAASAVDIATAPPSWPAALIVVVASVVLITRSALEVRRRAADAP